jgi:hypothetical protein
MMAVTTMERTMPGSETAMQLFLDQLNRLSADIQGMRGELRTLNDFFAEARGENLKGRIAKLEDERVKLIEVRVTALETAQLTQASASGGAKRTWQSIGFYLAAALGWLFVIWQAVIAALQYFYPKK